MDGEIPPWARRCPTGKIKYQSALEVRKKFRSRRSKSSSSNLYTYRCERCGFVHTSEFRPGADKRLKRKRGSPDCVRIPPA